MTEGLLRLLEDWARRADAGEVEISPPEAARAQRLAREDPADARELARLIGHLVPLNVVSLPGPGLYRPNLPAPERRERHNARRRRLTLARGRAG